MYGLGIEQDLMEAEQWYQIAPDAGYEPDNEDQRHLAEVMGEDLGEDFQNKERNGI